MPKQKKPRCGKGQSCGWACIEASDVCTDRVSAEIVSSMANALSAHGVNLSSIGSVIKAMSQVTGTFDEIMAKVKLTASSPTTAIAYEGGIMYTSTAMVDGKPLLVTLIEHGEGKDLKRYTVADGFLKEVTASGSKTTGWMEAVQASVRAVAKADQKSLKQVVTETVFAGHEIVPVNLPAKLEYLSQFTDDPKALLSTIKGWTKSNFGVMRAIDAVADRQELARTYPDWQKLEKANNDLNDFLSKAPKFRGQIHRGLSVYKDEDLQKFLNDDVIELDAKSSFSSSEKQARDFAREEAWASSSIVLTVRANKSGVSIQNLSNYSPEKEVLVPAGAKYRVVNRTVSNKSWNSKLKIIDIELEEID